MYPKMLNCAGKFILIVDRVDPQIVNIGARKTRHFESHKYHLINESQIASNEFGEHREPSIGLFVQDNADFNSLSELLKVENATNRLIVRSICLNDIVVHT